MDIYTPFIGYTRWQPHKIRGNNASFATFTSFFFAHLNLHFLLVILLRSKFYQGHYFFQKLSHGCGIQTVRTFFKARISYRLYFLNI